ncbi:MAG TPA: hypothetical protein PK389_05485 [Gammaproteobacteria bacterium]|nr:hypothetical protein [Gammaproteobacteria bacterium]
MGTPAAAHGALIKIGNGASSETFATIDDVTAGPDGGGLSTTMLTARVHSQASEVKRVSGTTTEPISFTVLYDSADTQHALIKTNAAAKTRTNFQIVGADFGAEQMAFAAYIGYNFSKNPDGWDEMSVTLEIDGDVTFT